MLGDTLFSLFRKYQSKLHKLVYIPLARTKVTVKVGDIYLGNSQRYYHCTYFPSFSNIIAPYTTLSGPNTYLMVIDEIVEQKFKYSSEVLTLVNGNKEWVERPLKNSYSDLDELKYEIYCKHLNLIAPSKLFKHLSTAL